MVVLDQAHDVAGIVSERDIVRVVAELGAEGLSQPISDCMTRDVVFADPHETVDPAAEPHDRPAHPPPAGLRDGRLVGIVSIGDLVKSKIAETVAEAENLKAYISA